MSRSGWGAALFGGARIDRALILALLAGGILGGALLWSHVSDRIERFETVLGVQVRTRAGALDMQMHTAIGHLEALRQRAEFFYAEYPAPDEVPDTSLLSTLLASNPDDTAGRLYSMDRLPPPYLVDQIGNIIALSSAAVAADPTLSRPDHAGWRQEAAMAVQMLPLMAVTQRVVPQARRLVYASLSGMVAVQPWVESSRDNMLSRVTTYAPFQRAAPAANPSGRPVWTLPDPDAGDAASAFVALPVSLQGRYAGALALEMPIAGLKETLGAVSRNDAMLLLVDADGGVITGNGAAGGASLPRHVRDVYPAGLPAEASGEIVIGRGLIQPQIVVVPLRNSPWQVVYIAPALSALLSILMDILISVAGFIASVLVVIFVSRRLMQRALAVRDAAAAAERQARADAERALADLRAAHDELDFLNREKTRFFSLISHDLRGPFNAMLGMTQELADHAPKMRAEDTADFARSVHEMARRVFDLLENLLQWSRVQMSGTPFAPGVFPMREVVGDAIRDVASAAQAKDIQILDASGDRWVLADRTMILAVLRNLLMNAVKFSHQGGVVHVTSRALGDRLELAVTDKGVGMEPAQLEQALRAGPKPSRPGTQGETGTGLGLTLVRDLVLRHGGELKLESMPGRGTIASFTVPLSTDLAETRRLMVRAAD
ncbi:sensor histidine kinase [Niveispirillum fermenti]|uniref:sensor histidine kinase n=1 Tax=Niveispirillum fermenti TaxID=1233113 RepID=UPI003A8847D6